MGQVIILRALPLVQEGRYIIPRLLCRQLPLGSVWGCKVRPGPACQSFGVLAPVTIMLTTKPLWLVTSGHICQEQFIKRTSMHGMWLQLLDHCRHPLPYSDR